MTYLHRLSIQVKVYTGLNMNEFQANLPMYSSIPVQVYNDCSTNSSCFWFTTVIRPRNTPRNLLVVLSGSKYPRTNWIDSEMVLTSLQASSEHNRIGLLVRSHRIQCRWRVQSDLRVFDDRARSWFDQPRSHTYTHSGTGLFHCHGQLWCGDWRWRCCDSVLAVFTRRVCGPPKHVCEAISGLHSIQQSALNHETLQKENTVQGQTSIVFESERMLPAQRFRG